MLGLKDKILAQHRQAPGFDSKDRKMNILKANVKTQLILVLILALCLINVLILMDFQ